LSKKQTEAPTITFLSSGVEVFNSKKKLVYNPSQNERFGHWSSFFLKTLKKIFLKSSVLVLLNRFWFSPEISGFAHTSVCLIFPIITKAIFV